MMDWEYRVAKFDNKTETYYGIVEAFSNERGEIVGITGEPFFPAANTVKELAMDVKAMAEALAKPVLDTTGIPTAMEQHETIQ